MLERQVWLIVLLALLPRAAHLALTHDRMVTNDSFEYEDLAWKIARGLPYTSTSNLKLMFAPPGEPTALRTPGLPAFAAGIYAAVGRRPFVVRIALVLLNALAAGLLFVTSDRAFGRRVGWLSGITWSLWPGSITTHFSADTFLAESLAVPLFVLTLWCLVAARSNRDVVLAGFCFGFTTLTRAYLVLVFPVSLALAFVAGRPREKIVKRLLTLTAISALVVGGWTARNLVAFGRVIPLSTQSGVAFWLGHNWNARGSWNGNWVSSPEVRDLLRREPSLVYVSEPAKSAIYVRAAAEDIRRGGGKWLLWLEARKVALFFFPFDADSGFLFWLVPAFLLLPFGAICAIRRGDDFSILLVGSVLSMLLVTVLTFHDSRYRFCVEPAIVTLAALGAARLSDRIGGRSGKELDPTS